MSFFGSAVAQAHAWSVRSQKNSAPGEEGRSTMVAARFATRCIDKQFRTEEATMPSVVLRVPRLLSGAIALGLVAACAAPSTPSAGSGRGAESAGTTSGHER